MCFGIKVIFGCEYGGVGVIDEVSVLDCLCYINHETKIFFVQQKNSVRLGPSPNKPQCGCAASWRPRQLARGDGVHKRAVLRERLANSPLRKVSEPVCCGEVDVKIAYDRISTRTVGAFCALLRSRASGR